jgi:hypothetical protein
MDHHRTRHCKKERSVRQSLMKLGPSLLGIAAIVACGSDSTAPTATVAGNYHATEFVTTGSSGQTNQLLAGSTLLLNLTGNGTLSGHLHMVATGSNPALEADMAGTWVQTGSTVKLTTPAVDTFVEDITYAVVANGNSWQLVGNSVFAGTDIKITLSQFGPD